MRNPSTLEVSRDDGVVAITLARPDRLNAITPDLWHELSDALREIDECPADRVVVIAGAGDNFCSGVDLAHTVDGHPLELMRTINAVVSSLHHLRQPTIAAVDGVAYGIGMNIALACDFVLAAERARFAEVFVQRGLSVDGGGTWMLPRLVGPQRAKALALLGDPVGAATAASLGLVNRVVPTDELPQETAALARRLADGPPIAIAQTKRLMNRAFENTFDQALEEEAAAQAINCATEDLREAMQAFADGREPVYQGR